MQSAGCQDCRGTLSAGEEEKVIFLSSCTSRQGQAVRAMSRLGTPRLAEVTSACQMQAAKEGSGPSSAGSVPSALASLDKQLMGHCNILECAPPLCCSPPCRQCPGCSTDSSSSGL